MEKPDAENYKLFVDLLNWEPKTGDDFLSIETLGFGRSSHFASPNTAFPKHAHLKNVKAITVNKIHGNELSIAKAMDRFKPQIESMEGAAFFYACDQSSTDCIQIRAISNYVEARKHENSDRVVSLTNAPVNAEVVVTEFCF